MPGAKGFNLTATGKMCPGCGEDKPLSEFHKNRRHSSGVASRCKVCQAAYAGQYQRQNRERATENNRRWRIDNREHYLASKRAYRTRVRYGLVDRAAYIEQQGATCGVCGTDEQGGRHNDWVIDHDHKSGQVRGILCSADNLAIGILNEDVERFHAAACHMLKSVDVIGISRVDPLLTSHIG